MDLKDTRPSTVRIARVASAHLRQPGDSLSCSLQLLTTTRIAEVGQPEPLRVEEPGSNVLRYGPPPNSPLITAKVRQPEGVPGLRDAFAVRPEMDGKGRERPLRGRPRGDLERGGVPRNP